MNVTIANPVQIDTALAALHGAYSVALQAARSAHLYLTKAKEGQAKHEAGNLSYSSCTQSMVDRAQARYTAECETMSTLSDTVGEIMEAAAARAAKLWV